MEAGWIRDRIEQITGRRAPPRITLTGDTTEFMRIDPGHVLVLGGKHYFVEGDMREGRFGLDDDPKFWVKKCREVETGDRKVLKLVFHEEFRLRIGLLAIRCLRDANKEAAVLDRVRGDERFMQGYTVPDDRGNAVRIIDLIRGKSLYRRLRDETVDHRTWFTTMLPACLAKFVGSVEAIADLHAAGLHHGDVRTDHIFVERDTERFRWIDFDLEPSIPDFDVWSLGNVLLYIVGMGEHAIRDVERRGRVDGGLTDEDASAFFPHRVMNLRKILPWVPVDLNDVLMHFSFGTKDFYETAADFLADLTPVAARLVQEGGAT